jgi:hypothetical protein
MTRNPPPRTCAICVEPIRGEVYLEPIGLNDAIVAACSRCAVQAVPDPDITPHSILRAKGTPVAVRLRQHRDRLKAAGLCVNGANHGKATRGTRCEVCADRDARKAAP